jgi:hypothetical protein
VDAARVALNGYASLVIGISKILMTSNSTKVARRTMELEHDDLLVDHIQFNESLKYRIELNSLSARPRNALKRALLQTGEWQPHSKRFEIMKNLNFVELRDISKLRISDVRDLNNVGESTLVELIGELQKALAEMTQDENPGETNFEIDSLESMRLNITSAQSIEELTEAMIDYQKSIRDMSDREEMIWRNRLPWITDSPKTLDSIGTALGVTRERIRQIQRKSSKYAYEVNSKIMVLSEVQNILLECSNYEEFREAMIEDGLTQEQSITIGRIRHLAVELGQDEVVFEVERAIYAWSQG